MSNQTALEPSCSEELSAIILCSIQEIIGEAGLIAVLKHSGIPSTEAVPCSEMVKQPLRYSDISRIQSSLEVLLGTRSGRGVALRSGRVMFRQILREFGQQLGFSDLVFRLLPMEDKLTNGVDILAQIMAKHMDMNVSVTSNDTKVILTINRCPICWERDADTAVCHMVVGMLQEVAYWISGGKIYIIEEKSCKSVGYPACIFEIQKRHLE